MKKLLLLLLLLLLTMAVMTAATCFAQDSEEPRSAKEMMAAIEGKYTIDDNGNATYVKIIEAPNLSRDEIFLRAQNYFTYNYGSGKSVLQTNDKEQGILVGKGLFGNVHLGASLIAVLYEAWHILRIDVKDGRARAVLTLIQYDKTMQDMDGRKSYATSSISNEYPINPKGSNKTMAMKAFYKSHLRVFKTFDELESQIKGGSTSSSIENQDW